MLQSFLTRLQTASMHCSSHPTAVRHQRAETACPRATPKPRPGATIHPTTPPPYHYTQVLLDTLPLRDSPAYRSAAPISELKPPVRRTRPERPKIPGQNTPCTPCTARISLPDPQHSDTGSTDLLKIGCTVILLRNLDAQRGLCKWYRPLHEADGAPSAYLYYPWRRPRS